MLDAGIETKNANDALSALKSFSDEEQVLTSHLYFKIQGKPGTEIISKKIKYPVKYFKGTGKKKIIQIKYDQCYKFQIKS